MKNRNGWHLFLRNELDFYPNRGIIGKHNADVAERQTRWFQVPVLRDVWVQIPSSAPNSRNPNPKPVGEGFGFLFVFGDM